MRWQKRAISARNFSSDTDGILSQQTASSEPVGKIENHSGEQPIAKSLPGYQRQRSHENDAGDDSQDRHPRKKRSFERTRPMRIADAKDDDAQADEDEREERADIREIDHLLDAAEHRADANRNTGQNRR